MPVTFPHSIECGPIEAFLSGYSGRMFIYFRTQLSAAPLKHVEEGVADELGGLISALN